MKKKLVLLSFIAIVMLLVITTCANIISGSAYARFENVDLGETEYYHNVKHSVDLYENVINQYKIKTTKFVDREITVYSEDYAGVFIDEQGILNIGIVGDNAKINRKQLSSPYGNKVIFKQDIFYL